MPGGWEGRPLLPVLVEERVDALGHRPTHLPVDPGRRGLRGWAQWRRQHLRLRSRNWFLLHWRQEPVQILQKTEHNVLYLCCMYLYTCIILEFMFGWGQ